MAISESEIADEIERLHKIATQPVGEFDIMAQNERVSAVIAIRNKLPDVIKALRRHINLAEELARASCTWKREDADYGTWRTGCDHVFQLNEGGPEENKMAFCCYCGGRLTELASQSQEEKRS